MAIKGTFFGIDAATLQSMKADWIACLHGIAAAGQSYQIAGRQFTRADLAEVKDTIAEIQAAIERASGTRVTQTYANFR